MSSANSLCVVVSVYLALVTTALAQAATDDQTDARQDTSPKPEAFLESLVGSWEGTCRTWFRPGELADESKVKGEFQPILDGRLLRHAYEGTIQGKPRTGEETMSGLVDLGPITAVWWLAIIAQLIRKGRSRDAESREAA